MTRQPPVSALLRPILSYTERRYKQSGPVNARMKMKERYCVQDLTIPSYSYTSSDYLCYLFAFEPSFFVSRLVMLGPAEQKQLLSRRSGPITSMMISLSNGGASIFAEKVPRKGSSKARSCPYYFVPPPPRAPFSKNPALQPASKHLLHTPPLPPKNFLPPACQLSPWGH